MQAEAEAYAVRVKAEAEAEQTRVVASAIHDNGQPAIDFEIMKRQVLAIAELAGSENSKTLVIPTDITKVLGSLSAVTELVRKND